MKQSSSQMPYRLRKYLIKPKKDKTLVKNEISANNNFVFMNRMGGLGNQLFQYAAARSVASYYPNTQIYMDIEKHNCHNHLAHDYACIFMKDVIIKPNITCSNEYHETYSFAPWHPKNFKLPIKLFGYFQYLPAIEPVIKDLVTEFQKALKPFCLYTFNPQTTVFIHVRRGDYLQVLDNKNILTKSYYEKAFSEWRKRFIGNDFKIFLISDDLEWCRHQLWTFPYELYESQDEIQTLALMSNCRAGAIIANSTFSYWGATLSQSSLVFYPRTWTGEDDHCICPSHWYALEK